MHLLGLLLLPTLLCDLTRAAEDYYEYDYEQEEEQGAVQDYSQTDLEHRLRSVASMDELLKIVYPNYWRMHKCRSKRGMRFPAREPSASDGKEPVKFAAAFFDNTELFSRIDSEWRKTQCMPREVCIDVGKEFGAAANTFYKPSCVSVYRCGGCCSTEKLQCMNISTSYTSKTLFEITAPFQHGAKPVTISFANHTLCSCLSKQDIYKQAHFIIRRALAECNVANKTCPKGQSWDRRLCRCVQQDIHFPSHSSGSDFYADDDVCGPDKELDEETCECRCKNHPRPSSCGPGRVLDQNTCQCVCKAPPTSCRPSQVFNKDTCECTCTKVCPKHQPLNRNKCVCECTESRNRCIGRGRRFHPATCSCYRPPCAARWKCEAGYFFSEEVCRCVPTHWRRLD